MKPKLIPTNTEVVMNDNEFIVSKTDIKGRVSYANRTFMKMAAYSESELIGKQHNIVRHPDMPRGAFKLLWDTLEQKNEFFALVKNMTSHGDYYWVFAHVTPDWDVNDNIIGYYSVRRKPKAESIKLITPIYQEMLTIEKNAGAANACQASIEFLNNKLKQLNLSYEKFILSLS